MSRLTKHAIWMGLASLAVAGAAGGRAAPAAQTEAVDSGSRSIWAPLWASPAGCSIERLAPQKDLRLFTWRACEGAEQCQRAELSPAFSSVNGFLASSALDPAPRPGEPARAVLAMTDPDGFVVVVADAEGRAIDGYRAPRARAERCIMATAALRASRFGVVVSSTHGDDTKRLATLLGPPGAERPPEPFEIAPAPAGSGPAPAVLGDDRWLFRYWTPRLYSVDAARGGDLIEVSPFDAATVIEQGPIATDGASFFVQRIVKDEVGNAVSRIEVTDGKRRPGPLFEPPQGTFDGVPAFAGSHLAWFRGIDPKSVNRFASVELWATRWEGRSKAMSPARVASYPLSNMPTRLTAGEGFVAAPAGPSAPHETLVFRLADGAIERLRLPEGQRVFHYVGVTQKALWALASNGSENRGRTLLRLDRTK